MDVLDSRRGEDSVASKPPSLVETANEVEPPVFRLPTELTRLIFGEFRSNTRLRLTLTHICNRWREIAVNDASLWTDIYIDTITGESYSSLDNFLSFLGMQLDRTANLMLDVQWFAEIGEENFFATLQLIRQKAPFSRWRTLRVYIFGGYPQSLPWATAADAFTNLQCLFAWHGTDDTIFRVIDNTITSHLDLLDLRAWPGAMHAKMITSFRRSLSNASSLIFGSFPPSRNTPFLPANIVNVELDWAIVHPFPHIQTYKLMECTFIENNVISLERMTALIISGHLAIACQVFLPALRQLTLKTLWMGENGKIEAPTLNTLYFINENIPRADTDAEQVAQIDKSLVWPGYLISPTTSIKADSYLPSGALLNALAKSPKVTQATLRFDDWAGCQSVLERLLAFGTETDSRSAESETLCPRLSELRLDFAWRLSASSTSRKWLIDRLHSRRDAGMAPLWIYASWKGEGAYVLLTGD